MISKLGIHNLKERKTVRERKERKLQLKKENKDNMKI